MEYSEGKQFKVTQRADNPKQGFVMCLVVARDGECWEVAKIPNHPEDEWPMNEGDVVEVPLRDSLGRLVPDWLGVHCFASRPLDMKDRKKVATAAWGSEVAEDFNVLDSTPKVISVDGTRVSGHQRRAAVKKPVGDKADFFVPDNFRPTPTYTQKEKADLANAFVRFTDGKEGAFVAKNFTPPLYAALTLMFGFQHTDKDAFYKENFATAAARLAFAERIISYTPANDPDASLVDVERAIKAFTFQRLLPKLKLRATTVEAMKERVALKELLLKHGLPEDFKLPGQ